MAFTGIRIQSKKKTDLIDIPQQIKKIVHDMKIESDSCIVEESVTVPIEDSAVTLGTWRGIYFCEFNGPRRRSAAIIIIHG